MASSISHAVFLVNLSILGLPQQCESVQFSGGSERCLDRTSRGSTRDLSFPRCIRRDGVKQPKGAFLIHNGCVAHFANQSRARLKEA